jgi:hypothetical protein
MTMMIFAPDRVCTLALRAGFANASRDVEYYPDGPVMLRIRAAGNRRVPEIIHENRQSLVDNGIVAGCGGMRGAQAANRGGK